MKTKKIIGTVFVLLLVFCSGFFCGILWSKRNSTTDNVPDSISVPNREDKPGQEPKNRPDAKESGRKDVADEKTEDEKRLEKALEDPDFKRVHDSLVREYPGEIHIPERKSVVPGKREPMSERPPIRFTPQGSGANP